LCGIHIEPGGDAQCYSVKKSSVADEALRILKQRSVASVRVKDQLSIFQMLEHEIRIAVGQHRIVAAAYDQDRLVDRAEDLIIRVFGRAH
jgi:hypothetical protein